MKLREQFLKDAPFCEVPDCLTQRSTQIHHTNHREGETVIGYEIFHGRMHQLHHRKIHDNPAWAREKGLR
jgi:hypothetical protein